MNEEPIHFMTMEDHRNFCALNERKSNERFAAMLDRFADGTERMNRIEANIERINVNLEKHTEVNDQRMDRMDAGLQQNTAVTQEIKEILDTAKGAFRFFGHMGNALKWVLGFGAAALGFWVALKDFRSH